MTIDGALTDEEKVYGFIIQARDVKTHRPVGRFQATGAKSETKGTCADE